MIVITLGDPFSINIECIAKILLNSCFYQEIIEEHPLVLIGSYKAWENQTYKMRPLPFNLLKNIIFPLKKGLHFYNLDEKIPYDKTLSHKYRAFVSKKSLSTLQSFPLTSKVAILSCPLDKKLTFGNDKNPAGQTEFFERLSNKKALMVMSSPKLCVGLVTNHLALSQVPTAITKKVLQEKLYLFSSFMKKRISNRTPRIAVCSLNPHCGDGGIFGSEDKEIIEPAIKEMLISSQSTNCEVFGPLSADTIFWKASNGEYDGILAMYHDQGLPAIKALDFQKTVNISFGLNFLRVSPAHGPATDLFMQEKANISGFKESFHTILCHLSREKNA